MEIFIEEEENGNGTQRRNQNTQSSDDRFKGVRSNRIRSTWRDDSSSFSSSNGDWDTWFSGPFRQSQQQEQRHRRLQKALHPAG